MIEGYNAAENPEEPEDISPERLAAYENLRAAAKEQRKVGPMTPELDQALDALDRLDQEKP